MCPASTQSFSSPLANPNARLVQPRIGQKKIQFSTRKILRLGPMNHMATAGAPRAPPPRGGAARPPSGLQRRYRVVGLRRWRTGQCPRRAVLAMRPKRTTVPMSCMRHRASIVTLYGNPACSAQSRPDSVVAVPHAASRARLYALFRRAAGCRAS